VRIFGPKRDEATGGWRKLHNEELHSLFTSPSIIRIIKSWMRWTGLIARMPKKRIAYSKLVGKPESKKLLGKPRRRWVYNIEMDRTVKGWPKKRIAYSKLVGKPERKKPLGKPRRRWVYNIEML
jgi:hypothetical protein